ncbi:MAG: four helix bundle protein [Xanthomonadaceae bacterium]|nr:four helix bundle protein [Xanthomonadaceae bacterium]
MSAVIRNLNEVKAYRAAFHLQQRIYVLSRHWPREEAYSLTARLLRSVRAIGADLAQLWTRRPEPAEFTARLSIVDAEVAETVHWLETAYRCGYLEKEQYQSLIKECDALCNMLTAMARASQKISVEDEAEHKVFWLDR